jgi:hypothetical protein
VRGDGKQEVKKKGKNKQTGRKKQNKKVSKV